MMKFNHGKLALPLLSLAMLAGCGSDGADGATGPKGEPGIPGRDANMHVTTLESPAQLHTELDYANLIVTGNQPFQGRFKLKATAADGSLRPFSGLTALTLFVASEQENFTEPKQGGPTYWLSHTQANLRMPDSPRAEFNDGSNGMPCGIEGQGVNLSGAPIDTQCLLSEDPNEPGSYTLNWKGDGQAPVILSNGNDRNVHRVMIQYWGIRDDSGKPLSQKVLSTPIDFIPATGALAKAERNSVASSACQKCHNPDDAFTGEDKRVLNWKTHGNFQKVENCIQCHTPAINGGENDPIIGWNADLPAMIHRLHRGYDNFKVLTGEAKDYDQLNWGLHFFPGEITECFRCHNQGDAYKTNPNMDACEGCHAGDKSQFSDLFDHASASSDEPCELCHTPDKLESQHGSKARQKAHKRLKVEITKVSYQEDITDVVGGKDLGIDEWGQRTLDRLTLDLNITIDGQPVPDDFNFRDYAPVYKKSLTGHISYLRVGTVDDNGMVTRASESLATIEQHMEGSVELMDRPVKDGKMHIDHIGQMNFKGKSFYVTSKLAVCANSQGNIAKCGTQWDNTKKKVKFAKGIKDGIQVGFDNYYFDSTKPNDGIGYDTGNIARMSQPDRISVAPEKCQACHGDMMIKLYGMSRFDQCMDCHNNTWGNSGHMYTDWTNGGIYPTDPEDPNYDPLRAGLPMSTNMTKEQPWLSWANRDLATVAHRRHSGLWDRFPTWAQPPEVHRNEQGELNSYPAVEDKCTVCHVEDTPIFRADGNGLTSGRRAVAMGAAPSPLAPNAQDADLLAFKHLGKDGVKLALSSTTMQLWNGYGSPTAEACRGCHAHTDQAAIAHFKQNGATMMEFDPNTYGLPVDGDGEVRGFKPFERADNGLPPLILKELPDSAKPGADALGLSHLIPGMPYYIPVANPDYVPYTGAGLAATPEEVPMESCGVCHAEGKQFGIDKVHNF